MIVPAIEELSLCRRLKCSWAELQQIPEERLLVWQALFAGEDQAHREKAAHANAGG